MNCGDVAPLLWGSCICVQHGTIGDGLDLELTTEASLHNCHRPKMTRRHATAHLGKSSLFPGMRRVRSSLSCELLDHSTTRRLLRGRNKWANQSLSECYYARRNIFGGALTFSPGVLIRGTPPKKISQGGLFSFSYASFRRSVSIQSLRKFRE